MNEHILTHVYDQGNYSVQFDGDIVFLSALAPQMQYRQLLYHATFPGNASSEHLVQLTALLNATNNWLDLDYISFSLSSK